MGAQVDSSRTSSPEPSSAEVSARLSRQSRQGTAPEMAIRRRLHGDGLRYRVGWPVPGRSRRSIDIAFTRVRVGVFIDGCFWHGCPDHATSPRANSAWWREKLDRNRARDRDTNEAMSEAGWVALRFWEHEDSDEAADRIRDVVHSRR
ncbi:very short patch repair endonuclease [Nocardioidaceae bacterium]|nr:very short patch repair endonuclease [Nocardioidaceae bacterium]